MISCKECVKFYYPNTNQFAIIVGYIGIKGCKYHECTRV